MAKKKQGVSKASKASKAPKASTSQESTTKTLVLSDQHSVARFVDDEYELSRQHMLNIRKTHPEYKNILEEAELMEPFFSRRKKAAVSYIPLVMKRYEKYPNVRPDDFTTFFSQPTLCMSDLKYRGSLSTGAALWILDTLKDNGKMYCLEKFLDMNEK